MGNSTGQFEGERLDDEKISLRISSKELQDLDAYLNEHPELGSRSLFIRTAVREYINRDADVPKNRESDNSRTVTVRVTEPQMMAIDSRVGVDLVDREEFFRRLLIRELEVGEMAEGAYKRAFQVATSDIPL